MSLQIINTDLLPQYLLHIKGIKTTFDVLKDAEISTNTFSFYTSVSSVYSSKIEGEDIDLDSYIKHRSMGIKFKHDYTKKTDDLYNAYQFANTHELTPINIAKAHKLISKNILPKNQQGKIRNQNMYVTTADGRIDYVAVSPFKVQYEMEKFYQDVANLLSQNLSHEEVFYYAAFIHLVFLKIHPWDDGNGRCSRLLEKWFIAQKLGQKAWFLQTEKYYYLHHDQYYQNIRNLGLDYEYLDFNKALPFLLMLP
jgi:Fic family protein